MRVHSWRGRKPSSTDVDLSNLSSLFDRQVIETIVRSSTPPIPPEELKETEEPEEPEEPRNHGMFHCMSEI